MKVGDRLWLMGEELRLEGILEHDVPAGQYVVRFHLAHAEHDHVVTEVATAAGEVLYRLRRPVPMVKGDVLTLSMDDGRSPEVRKQLEAEQLQDLRLDADLVQAELESDPGEQAGGFGVELNP